ncbi:hypothetical protein KP509_28G001300 [Ceratopteris richardii]|uniref:PPM-type phosphatase domain-containing protein n=1 Tax=Ceratopteris richardii TaxID=49495 RepID=A0A8T2RBE4_CERRI|nr:hypothetical protein KP509_28G001300 [Ceratopteris richardii]
MEAVQHAYLETDAAFANACSLNNALSFGTTAITVLILAREIFVANAGDCRAVLCRRGKAIEMSRNHKPHVERSRIEALGGYIYDGYLNGYLSVARAFENWHIEGLKGVNCPLIVEPEVRREVLILDDEFMIIGCDGFWDVFTNESAVAFARKRLQQHNDPEQCSHDLVDEALRRCSSDNLTVVTVCFQKSPPPRLVPRKEVKEEIGRKHFERGKSFAEGRDRRWRLALAIKGKKKHLGTHQRESWASRRGPWFWDLRTHTEEEGILLKSGICGYPHVEDY